MAKETSITGVTLFTSDQDDLQMMYSHINALIKSNCLKPVLGKVYPLKEAAQAQADVINNTGSLGRLTLVTDN